ncbi:VOC family protein [Nocardia sp.]|uniref:VOC family protein n=1 Tax=Nocardia sp. TaxID=1821 RepID=UPI00261A31BC|nr:VOC family protein [Nocardia sp.]
MVCWVHGTELETGDRQRECACPGGLLGPGAGGRGPPARSSTSYWPPATSPDAAVPEHKGRKTFRGYAAVRHPEDPFDETSGIGHGRRLLFQDVAEPKTTKNRLHIDVHSEPGGLEKLVTRLDDLGATRVREIRQGPRRPLVGHARSGRQ